MIKIGAKVVGHARYFAFQMAEVAIQFAACPNRAAYAGAHAAGEAALTHGG
jgi:hypothetical protein